MEEVMGGRMMRPEDLLFAFLPLSVPFPLLCFSFCLFFFLFFFSVSFLVLGPFGRSSRMQILQEVK